MRTTTILLTAALLAGFAAPVAAAEDDIHIKGTTNDSWPWNVTDGANCRWDVYQYGGVSNGQNNAYSGGMQLQVDSSSFSWSGQGQVGKDGREIECGPWKVKNVQVWRRVYVDNRIGYARWIDIFENSGSSDVTLRVRYSNNMGNSIQTIQTSTGGSGKPTDKDWGFVTDDGNSGNRPAVMHVYATKGSKYRPTIECNVGNNTMYYNFSVKVPAGKYVALCLFEAQRNQTADAAKLLKSFNPSRELANISPALRKAILNVSGSVLSLETVELSRDDRADLAVLRGGDEYKGKLKNEHYVVDTFFGELDLPAAQVLGLAVPAADDPYVQIVLADGQVVAGKLKSGPLSFELDNGSEMTLPVEKIQSASYRISTERPGEIAFKNAMVVLRNGQQLFFREEDAACAFHTEYGDVQLAPGELQTLYTDTPEGGLHRAVFRNGSVLSGLLVPEEFKLKLDLGPTLTVKRALIARLAFPGSPDDKAGLSTMVLRNEDELYGQIVDETLSLVNRFGAAGNTQVARDEIAHLETVPGALGRVQIKLHSGSSVSGRLVGETIRFKIDNGPELPVFIGHITSVTCPKPPPKPASSPASGPAGAAVSSTSAPSGTGAVSGTDTVAGTGAVSGASAPAPAAAKKAGLAPAKSAAVAVKASVASADDLQKQIADRKARLEKVLEMQKNAASAGQNEKADLFAKEADQLKAIIDELSKALADTTARRAADLEQLNAQLATLKGKQAELVKLGKKTEADELNKEIEKTAAAIAELTP